MRFANRRHPVRELRRRLQIAVDWLEDAVAFAIGVLALAFSAAVWREKDR